MRTLRLCIANADPRYSFMCRCVMTAETHRINNPKRERSPIQKITYSDATDQTGQ